jgi:hypothetical protein
MARIIDSRYPKVSRYPNSAERPNRLCHIPARRLTQTVRKSHRWPRPLPPTKN